MEARDIVLGEFLYRALGSGKAVITEVNPQALVSRAPDWDGGMVLRADANGVLDPCLCCGVMTPCFTTPPPTHGPVIPVCQWCFLVLGDDALHVLAFLLEVA